MKKNALFCKMFGLLLLVSLSFQTVGAEDGIDSADNSVSEVQLTTESQADNHSLENRLRHNGTIEAIIGEDDQFQVLDTSQDPYRKVVYLSMQFPEASYVGSGIVVGPDLVLTAAHNLYSAETQTWASAVTVIPAMNQYQEFYGIFQASDFWLMTDYQEWGDSAYDIALIRLEETLPAEVGFLPLTSEVTVGERIQIPGYPGVTGTKLGKMYTMFEEVADLDDIFLSYQVDTEPGQSGSPILNAQNEVVGIHILGSEEVNFGRRITVDVLEMVNSVGQNQATGGRIVHHQIPRETVIEIPTYRLYHAGIKRHLYTQDQGEVAILVTRGWRDEGVKFQTAATGTPVYRLYSSVTREHLYTTNSHEKNILVQRGWRAEGTAWYSSGETPVYRLYHRGLRVHLYTADSNERRVLIERGWQDEAIAWYVL